MSYIVSKYQCRIGNNLRQILNACIEAHDAGAYDLIIPKNWWIKESNILIGGNNPKAYKKAIFFHSPRDDWWMNKAREMVNKYLQNLLWASPEKPNKNQIVMHVRSGDVFKGGGASPNYFQPPYSYYLKCIEATEKKSILVVTEKDMRNPILSKLKQDFSNDITIQSSKVGKDMKTILEAEELVLAKSTFSRMLSLFCPYLKKVYSPYYKYQKSDKNGVSSINYKFPEYKSWRWQNSEKQKKHMMEYPINKITKF